MTEEELAATDVKTSQAAIACFAASGMLLLLYLFLDYIQTIFELYITVAGGIACSVVIQEVFLGIGVIHSLF